MNIFQRINAVMKDVTYIQKESKKVNGQYTFVSHDSVSAALHGPMTTHGIAMVPSILDLNQDGNRTTVKMDIGFVNIDKPEDRFNILAYGCGIDPSDKGIGKAISYAVKYALLKVFALETGDDVERDDFKPEPGKIIADDVVENKRKWLMSLFSEETQGMVEQFIEAASKKLQKSPAEFMLRYNDKDQFIDHFTKWQAKQTKG